MNGVGKYNRKLLVLGRARARVSLWLLQPFPASRAVLILFLSPTAFGILRRVGIRALLAKPAADWRCIARRGKGLFVA